MSKHKQKAWVLFWEWMSNHNAIEDKVAAILRPRMPRRVVAEIVQTIYAINHLVPEEMASLARRPNENPYKAQWYNNVCFVAGNPSLAAHYVSDLVVDVDPKSGLETISWTLPPLYRVSPDSGRPEEQRGSLRQSTTRTITGPLSSRKKGRNDFDN